MNKVSKITALIFSVLLLFISIHTADYSLNATSLIQEGGSENSGSAFSTVKPDILFLNRPDGRLIAAIKNLPVSNLRHVSVNFYNNKIASDFRILKINPEFFSYPVTVERNLSDCDIVFPFHNFW
jgi:hypothetical protein